MDEQLLPCRTIDELRELNELTADSDGAQRIAWSPVWLRARDWLREKLEMLPVEVEIDEAGNLWATLHGEHRAALLIGGHLDSVPNGGWLDGCLGTVAGLEVLRHISSQGLPPVTVKLVDWADEEGARFGGRSDSFGSATVAGTITPGALRGVLDAEGTSFEDALGQCGLSLDTAGEARGRLEGARAYIELHIEQGPILERLEIPLGVVVGTIGVKRHVVRFIGQASHAGATPMNARRDALMAAARFAVRARELTIAIQGGFSTIGSISVSPSIPTVVPWMCELTLDQRHLDSRVLAQLVDKAHRLAEDIAKDEGVTVEWGFLWGISPISFDQELVGISNEVLTEMLRRSHTMLSGALHDAAEIAQANVPSVMLFVQSLGGLSHTKEEDTNPEHLKLAVLALDNIIARVMASLATGKRQS